MTERRDLRRWWVLPISFIVVGVLALIWLSLPRENQVATVSPCPPRPQRIPPTLTPTPSTRSYLRVTYEGITLIGFDATADVAEDAGELGALFQVGRESYTLYVDSRYNFQEVLDYLNAWDECHDMIDLYIGGRIATDKSAPTPTPDDGQITVDTVDTDKLIIDGQCYFFGQEVSCEDD